MLKVVKVAKRMNLVDSREFRKKLLESKKKRVIEIVNSVCERENLPIPKVNFEGCPLEDQDQLAHYHSDQNKICISETQLHKLKTLRDVENTTYHELAHILEQSHGGEFEKTKNKFKLKDWRPPRGVQFISGEQVNEANERIRNDPKRLAWVNEDSDYVKFVEGRANHHENETGKHDSEKAEYTKNVKADIKMKITKKNKGKGRKVSVTKMSKKEIEEAKRRLFTEKEEEKEKNERKEKIEKKLEEELKKEREKVYMYPKVGMSKEEIEEARKKLGIDTEYKPRARPKKKGFFDKVKDALGVK